MARALGGWRGPWAGGKDPGRVERALGRRAAEKLVSLWLVFFPGEEEEAAGRCPCESVAVALTALKMDTKAQARVEPAPPERRGPS